MNAIGWFESAAASSELISLNRFIDPYIFATQSGGYGGAFRIRGIDPECLSDAELANISLRLVQVMRLLPENCSLYQTVIKRRGCHLQQSRYAGSANEVVAETQRKRHAYLTTRPLGTVELYWTISIHPPKARKHPQLGEHAAIAERAVGRLRSTLTVVSQTLSDLIGMEQLDSNGIAQLYGYLANLEAELVRQRLASRDHIGRQLARSPVRWHAEGLEIGRRHVKLFSLIQRPNATRPNLFGELIRLDADLVLVFESQRQSAVATRKCVSSHQSFKDLFRHSLLSILAHAKGGSEIAKSANTVAADKAVDDLGSVVDDIENRGLTHTQTSLIGMLHSRDKNELADRIAQVHRVFSQSEAAVLEEGIGSLSAYYSLFPAAARYGQSFNVRRFWLREDHLTNLSLVYAPYLGTPESEALEEEALAIFETRDRTPFYFDSYSNGLRGMLVIGSPRRGKSFLINFLMDMEPKHADSAQDALHRLGDLALAAHSNLSTEFVRAQVARTIHYVVHIERAVNGHRSVTECGRVKPGEFCVDPTLCGRRKEGGTMPFIEKQDRAERQELKVKIRAEVIALVEEYAKFLDSEPWYVVQEVLRKSITSDRDFRPQAAENVADAVKPNLKRGRKDGSAGAIRQDGKTSFESNVTGLNETTSGREL